jgi:hypothetical protein
MCAFERAALWSGSKPRRRISEYEVGVRNQRIPHSCAVFRCSRETAHSSGTLVELQTWSDPETLRSLSSTSRDAGGAPGCSWVGGFRGSPPWGGALHCDWGYKLSMRSGCGIADAEYAPCVRTIPLASGSRARGSTISAALGRSRRCKRPRSPRAITEVSTDG